MDPNPIIAIIGTGAIGGYYGARLVQHGRDVHFLLRSDFDAVRSNGWSIKSHLGDFSIAAERVRAYRSVSEMPKADLVIVTLKTTANDQFEALIRPLLKEQTAILTLQNGLGNEEALANLFGKQRILGGNAFVCVTRTAPGILHHQAEGTIKLGEFGGGPSPRATQLAELFTASGIDAGVVEDLQRARWQKLSWNIPFNGLGAVLDLSTDQLLEKHGEHVIDLMQETIAIASKLGIRFPPDWIEQMIRKTWAMGKYQTSMQIDRQAGRPTEIEAILGEPRRAAGSLGVAAPKLEELYGKAVQLDAAGMKNVKLKM
ncbi:MAG TPA: 2-dehydropantoate 2-reductase [Humisphaera sp.]|nr:2-dehydropantoate 2-reductase [Humisphaera sp.]